jgi:hypothetical protein
MSAKIFSHWIDSRHYTGYSPILYAFECTPQGRPYKEIGMATEYTVKPSRIKLNRDTENRVWAQQYLDMLRVRSDSNAYYLMEQIQPTNQEN